MQRWMGSLNRAPTAAGEPTRVRHAPVAVQVDANAGHATEYWPSRDGPLRLRAVHPPAAEGLPGDLGHLVDARTSDGDQLRAIVLARASAHPQAVVSGHIIALVRPPDAEEGWLLVVPDADPWLTSADFESLPRDVHQRVCAFLRTERLEWIGADEAEFEARQAIARGRRIVAAQRAERAAAEAAWTPTEAARRRWATFEGEAHTAAELDILRLPYRFQLYAREVILPQERLLASVFRPAMSHGQWPFGRRTDRDALIVLTTRQLLVLSDARPPDTMIRFGGFAARATAVERLAGAQVEPADDHVSLTVAVRSAAAVVPWTIVAPRDAQTDDVVSGIGQFAPRLNETLPARRGDVAPQDVDMTSWHAFFPEGSRELWLERVQQALGRDEQLLTWALSPDMPSEGVPAAATALTTGRLLAVGAQTTVREWPVESITTTEIRTSPFGSSLRVWTDRATPELVSPFPFTLSPAFLDLFLALRQRLTASGRASADS